MFGSIVVNHPTKPKLYTHAILQQQPNIDTEIVHVCCMLTKCEIECDHAGFQEMIFEKLTEATEQQKQKSVKAVYYHIKYNENGNNKFFEEQENMEFDNISFQKKSFVWWKQQQQKLKKSFMFIKKKVKKEE